jgi:phosphoenolpyruvate carboxykinase (ATP)
MQYYISTMATKLIEPASPYRAIIETALYANSVKPTTMAELYELASSQAEVIVTDMPMYKPAGFGLPKDAKVMVSNDGAFTGRTEHRSLLVRNFTSKQDAQYQGILREAIYNLNRKESLHLEGIVGLHPDFMVKAHLLSPRGDAKNMLDWGLNFTPFIKPFTDVYKDSRLLDEPDILVLADPYWEHPDFPHGCVIIDEANNCIAILGLRYFGERKKGTLTLSWAIGVRQNMVACHGGIKKIGKRPPIAIFGLTGQGRSSITNSLDHGGLLKKNENVTIVHDDAFLIDLEHDISVALEPSLFDKTDSCTLGDQKYFHSTQNVGVTLTDSSQKRLVCQDIRNPNGRCIKSRDILNNISDYTERPGKIIWLQMDTSLPPICKVKGSSLAVAMGASLSTTPRPTDKQDKQDKLHIEPFANPFRAHPVLEDSEQFRKLFKLGCECYIINPHAFGIPSDLIQVPDELVMAIITELMRGKIQWREWRTFHGLFIPKNSAELFGSDFDRKFKPKRNKEYLHFLLSRMQDRITYLSKKRDEEQDMSNNFIAPLVLSRTTVDRILNPDLYV